MFMEDFIMSAWSIIKGIYGRTVIIVFVAVLLYTFKFSVGWLVLLVVLNGYLSDNKNDALIAGAVLGYTIHLSVMISNAISHHLLKLPAIILMPVAGAIAGLTLSTLGYVTKHRGVVWILSTGIVAMGLPLWITSYHQFSNSKVPLLSSLILLSITTAVTVVYTELKAASVLFVMIISFFIALIIKFRIDFLEDSSSHNLLPFELMGELLAAFIFAAIGLSCGLAFKKKYAKDEYPEENI
jgi:hypothetical protein